MWDDPIVAEVHRIREQIAAECNYDLDAFFDRLQKEQDRHRDRLVRRDQPAEQSTESDQSRNGGVSETAPAA